MKKLDLDDDDYDVFKLKEDHNIKELEETLENGSFKYSIRSLKCGNIENDELSSPEEIKGAILTFQ